MSEKRDSIATFSKAFWAFMFVYLILSLGSGPTTLNVARLSVIGMVVIFYIATKIGSKTFLISGEALCLATLITMGVIVHNPLFVALAVVISLFLGVVFVQVKLSKKYPQLHF